MLHGIILAFLAIRFYLFILLLLLSSKITKDSREFLEISVDFKSHIGFSKRFHLPVQSDAHFHRTIFLLRLCWVR